MNSEDYIKSQISSSLGDAAKRARANLLLTSCAAIVIHHTGLIPNQIEGLGITFSQSQQGAFISCLLVLVSYQLFSFSLSAISDYHYAKLQRKAYTEDRMRNGDLLKKGKSFKEVYSDFNEIFHPLEMDPKVILKMHIYHLILDFLIPILTAIYAITALIILLIT